jgi:hypothetical protein
VKSGQAVQLNGSSGGVGTTPSNSWDIGGGLFFNIPNPGTVTPIASTVVNLPNGTYPVYLRVSDGRGGYGVSSKTTLTVTCGPRPNVTVSTTRLGPGKIRATLTAGQGTIGTLHIGQPNRPITNATVNVQGGQQNITTDGDVTVSGSQVILDVTRRLPGNAPVMVPLSIGDACGSWNSFVGFGTGV